MDFINDITEFIFISSPPGNADIIFIPGGSFPESSENAAHLWKQGYSGRILPSGKYSIKLGYFPGPMSKADIYTGQYSTEWEFMKDILVSKGVNEEAILKEDRATCTYENAVFSRAVIEKRDIKIRKAIICCKTFHARRCLMYYQSHFPETQFIVCPSETQGINRENWFKSDEGINKVMGELARCGSQFVEILRGFK